MMKHESKHESRIEPHTPDDGFDSFLRKQLQQENPYLDDDNFSANVMARLPAPKKLSRLQERLIIGVPLVIITLLILSQFSPLVVAIKIWTWLVALNFNSLFKIGFAMIVLAVSSASYWMAKQSRIL